MLRDNYDALRNTDEAPRDRGLAIELVFVEPIAPDVVLARITEALPGIPVEVTVVFHGDTDRFHFVDFPDLDAVGREAQAFQFARTLRQTVGAEEANPILTDSLYGAMAVGAASDESFLSACETPRVNLSPFGWVHPIIRTPQAWARTRGAGSTVAVIDTGHSTHQELAGAILQTGQANFVEGGSDASDRFVSGFLKHPGHGTLVCSVIASRGDCDTQGNTSGHGAVTGSAPEADILPIRAIRSVINFTQRTIPDAIEHAIDQGADVIAMAMGGATRVAATERALRDAVDAGLVVVCAAGNCWPSVVFPAAYAPNGLCTAVAALTNSLTPWGKTGSGPEVTLSAPGENVWGSAKNKSSDPDHGIRAAQGTTLATSLTAGVAALWVARHGGRAALKQAADAAGTTVQAMWVHCATSGLSKPPVWGGSGKLGAGVLDAEKALNTPLPTAPTGTEARPDAVLPATGVEPTANIALTHLANHHPEAAIEFGPDLADYAGELLWLSLRAGAKVRAAETSGLEAPVRPDQPSPALREALADKPALRGVVGGL
ncbi:hypothetical protein A8B78_04350 [Jannaschia sp. EhC01]|nr:hypothetical protein A8B78_04350 [Jannaschia sp. EhC01]